VITQSFYYNRFLFTGREYEGRFGIYHYRARAYHPRLGRFTSEDPKLFDAGDYNLFRYCHNDPLDLTDPMGLADEDRQPAMDMKQQTRDVERRLARLQFQMNAGAIATGLRTYDLAQRIGAASTEGAQQVSNWARGTASAIQRLGEFVSGTGPTIRVYGPNSVESKDMRTDPKYASQLAEAQRRGFSRVNFWTNEFKAAGINPTRQFVGSYEIRDGKIGDNHVTYIYNRTSVWSATPFHLLPAKFTTYERVDGMLTPGGNTYQAYITDVRHE
jgi:RHS repeat-associated protein